LLIVGKPLLLNNIFGRKLDSKSIQMNIVAYFACGGITAEM
jgi:hypothetical protein